MNGMKVFDVMTHLVVAFRPEDTIQEAARLMLDNRISGAPVVEEGRLVGIVSEADVVAAFTPPAKTRAALAAPVPLAFLLRGVAPRADTRVTVSDVMIRDVVTVSPEASLWEVASLIERHGVRRLPVVDDDGYLIGIIARADLVRSMARSDEQISEAVREAVKVLGEESFAALDIDTVGGVVTMMGTADRKSTRDLAISIASRVPGVLEVAADLDWEWDDTDLKSVRTPTDAREIGRDPWAVGPLMKEGVG